MDSPLHTKHKAAIQGVGGNSWKCPKESENGFICEKTVATVFGIFMERLTGKRQGRHMSLLNKSWGSYSD